MINVGDNNINVYVGDTEVSVYAGDELIYPLNFGELTAITLTNLTWVTDIPSSGGTGTSANCSYLITGYYDSGKTRKLNSKSTVFGEITASSTTSETREMVGTLVLTATCSGFSATGSVDAYQEAYKKYEQSYLTFRITSPGDIVWWTDYSQYAKTIEYSKDGGTTWSSITSSQSTRITVDTGEVVLFRGNNTTYGASSDSRASRFRMSTAGFILEGNIMSMLYGDDFANKTALSGDYTFKNFFSNCTGMTSAENLILPATTLNQYCYYQMFYGCTSLTSAPELPATTLKNSCYRNMFYNCTSLTTAPELPATTLTDSCYSSMFSGCSSLSYIKCLATNISASFCTLRWVDGVASTGTFVKAQSMTGWTTGGSGIPSGWTVLEE